MKPGEIFNDNLLLNKPSEMEWSRNALVALGWPHEQRAEIYDRDPPHEIARDEAELIVDGLNYILQRLSTPEHAVLRLTPVLRDFHSYGVYGTLSSD